MNKTLKQLRKSQNKTLIQVSKDTGISISLLSRLENFKVPYTNKSLKILEKYYNSKIENENFNIYLTDNEKERLLEENLNLREENHKLKELLQEICLKISNICYD